MFNDFHQSFPKAYPMKSPSPEDPVEDEKTLFSQIWELCSLHIHDYKTLPREMYQTSEEIRKSPQPDKRL